MSYSEYEQLYYKIVNETDELYGGQSEHFKKNLQKLTENADEGVSSEKIYSTALHESLEYQRNFIFLELGKVLFSKVGKRLK
ncbi:hypothetical protein [Staphylococcus aureus]|uniref:hypothetical protein n=1 Tax=Staphylococcus aureus TaxID=1280 RepID=UPI0011CACE3D|nr:hypothetical protein [Staphylococcus aureus]TXO01301.1 hypothetical protein FV119_10885 [Staphylococcus aureus]HCX2099078.1 hypothetical protein [Staphylococcus aureus]HCX2393473.1 hypothetical protein [Staphylococcus aureus]HCX3081266.1 hypothetical protein [Staphylococcus aureus]HCX3213794.1 hypothetical protein [Staphylococcus aureus]